MSLNYALVSFTALHRFFFDLHIPLLFTFAFVHVGIFVIISDFEAELDALASNLPSGANSPYTKGGCINELTSLLSISFAKKDVKPRF